MLLLKYALIVSYRGIDFNQKIYSLKDNKSNTNVYFGFKWSKIYSYKIAASFYMIVAPQKENQIKLIVRKETFLSNHKYKHMFIVRELLFESMVLYLLQQEV